jgi:hypothetical protein
MKGKLSCFEGMTIHWVTVLFSLVTLRLQLTCMMHLHQFPPAKLLLTVVFVFDNQKCVVLFVSPWPLDYWVS